MYNKRSPIWNHFIRIDASWAKCNICCSKLSHRTSISNLKTHLKRKHPTRKINDPIQILPEISSRVLPDSLNECIIEKLVEIKQEKSLEGNNKKYVKNGLRNTSGTAVQKALSKLTSVPTYISSTEHVKKSELPSKAVLVRRILDEHSKTTDYNVAEKYHNSLHEFDVFCNSLAIQLKKMPIHQSLVCQEKLQTVMTQHRLTFLCEDNRIAPSCETNLSGQNPLTSARMRASSAVTKMSDDWEPDLYQLEESL